MTYKKVTKNIKKNRKKIIAVIKKAIPLQQF